MLFVKYKYIGLLFFLPKSFSLRIYIVCLYNKLYPCPVSGVVIIFAVFAPLFSAASLLGFLDSTFRVEKTWWWLQRVQPSSVICTFATLHPGPFSISTGILYQQCPTYGRVTLVTRERFVLILSHTSTTAPAECINDKPQIQCSIKSPGQPCSWCEHQGAACTFTRGTQKKKRNR